jgi:replicative DNA helicase
MRNQDELGKIPPQSIDFEEAVLGAVMLESDSFLDICGILKECSFYKDSHQRIFKACTALFNSNQPIDMMSVMEQLRKQKELDEIGGALYLSELTSNIGSASHIVFHARIIQQKYIQRELIRISSEIQNKAFDDSIDVQDLIDYSEQELFNVKINGLKKEPKRLSDIGIDQLKILEEITKGEKDFAGLPTGLVAWDRITNGLQNKKVYIIAGRPGQGKTTLLISVAKNMALEFNIKVGIFSLEMGEDELWKKFVSDLTNIQYGKLSSKITTEWEQIESAQAQFENLDIYIDDTASISLMEIRAKARRLKMKKGIQIIFIDYLQLMSGDSKSGNREQEISKISRGLKILSKELDIPVVCLSQLSRATEQRPDKKPQLSDLRESGAIEQDADCVTFVFRPEYYGFEEDENQMSTKNRVDLIQAKNRGGETGEISIRRTPNFSKFYDESTIIEPLQDIENNEDLKPNEIF